MKSLNGSRIVLRPVMPEDRQRLREILAEPEVACWWNPGSPDHAIDDWLDMPPDSVFVIVHEGAVIGSIQFSEEDSPDYRHAAIDIFLDTTHHGQGLGSDALRTRTWHTSPWKIRSERKQTSKSAFASMSAAPAATRS